MVDEVRRDGTAAQSTLPAQVALADHNNVDLVEVTHLQERGTNVTVENVHRHREALFLEILAVRVHTLHRLLTQLLKQLVLLAGIDRERARHPRATKNVRRENSGQEDVALRVEHLLLHHVLEGKVTGLRAVHGKQDLVLFIAHLFTGMTHNVLVAGLLRNGHLVEGVTGLECRRLGDLRHPVWCKYSP